MAEISDRPIQVEALDRLLAQHLHPVLARVLAARGVRSKDVLEMSLAQLLPPSGLSNIEHMASILADAIAADRRLLIVADYDSDGATACALGVLALRAMGASVEYIVPNRFDYGYGLTPEIVRLAADRRPDFLITVDNGIASVEGVREAARLGMQVLITDHHLPGAELPAAACIVNPNQAGCGFPSKHLAGVGVMFYVLLQLRAHLRARGHFAARAEPNLANWLDLVALGTVADVVKLDDNNRVLVQQGLTRIRAGRARPGILALLRVAGREPLRAGVYDLGYVVGPRLNAAGRLSDMSLGIECLLAADDSSAARMAQELDALNRERRGIEAQMQDSALEHLERFEHQERWGVALFDEHWHQGVIGILAARIRERIHRPVIAFAAGTQGELKGSGRSIPALHLRDTLDLISKRHPNLIQRFGGHAAAAGLSIPNHHFDNFAQAFDQAVRTLATAADLQQRIETDGALRDEDIDFQLAETLSELVWGHGFPIPTFRDEFRVDQQRIVGGKHLRLRLRRVRGNRFFEAIYFGQTTHLPVAVELIYRLDINEYNNQRHLQLIIDHHRPTQ